MLGFIPTPPLATLFPSPSGNGRGVGKLSAPVRGERVGFRGATKCGSVPERGESSVLLDGGKWPKAEVGYIRGEKSMLPFPVPHSFILSFFHFFIFIL
jgi:hypothetical protein